VYRTAYSVTGSSQDAEDIVQNLFLHLVHRGLPPGLQENPKAYLYRSAVNLGLNVVKSRQRYIVEAGADYPEPSAGDAILAGIGAIRGRTPNSAPGPFKNVKHIARVWCASPNCSFFVPELPILF
jgi:hypothetical protein